MFGLENKKPKRFEFDLEKQLKKSHKEVKKILNLIDTQSNQLKSDLREGKASEHFDQCGLLLQAYAALERVVKRASKH